MFAVVLYSHLCLVTLRELSALWNKWLVDILDLDGDGLSDIWHFSFKQLVSLRDCLIQFKVVHQAYYTPYRVHKMVPNTPPDCWRCSHSRGDFIDIFWSYPIIAEHWEAVVNVIQRVSSWNLSPSLRVCLLGLVEELAPTVAERTMLGHLLFYPRKAITLTWKKPTPPTVSTWMKLVN